MYWWRSRKRRDQTRGCRLYLRKSAEKVRKDPTKSVVYDQYEEDREKYLNDADFNKPANFTWQQKLSLIIFGIALIAENFESGRIGKMTSIAAVGGQIVRSLRH